MAESCESQRLDEAQSLLRAGRRRPYRRWIHLRRKKMPKARLGGRRPPQAVALWRSIKESQIRKWVMKIRCDCMVKKVNELLGKENVGFDGFVKRILMEISLAVPVLGASLSI